jgi:hypothetical protein
MSNEARRLIAAWLQGEITPEDFAALQKLLLADASARHLLRREVNLDLVLREQTVVSDGLKAWSEPQTSAKVITMPQKRRRLWPALAMAASVALFFSIGSFFYGGSQALKAEAAREETNLGCAILTHVVNAEWLGDDADKRTGDTLGPGTLKLACGFAQIEFFSGATLLLEGDAELEIVSPWEAVCHSGKARVRVPPPAQGFQLHAPGMRLVDLGTEFGVQVNPEDLSSEVHVFEGEVEAYPVNKELINLKQGEGLRKDGTSVSPLTSVRPADFMGMEHMNEISARRAKVRYDAWAGWSDAHRSDPRLIAYFPLRHFNNWERVVPNATLPAHESRHGGIVGARWTEGRWPMKAALEFKRPGDRIRMKIDGEYEGVTLSSWVKVDGLDRKFNALLLTDGYESGEPHWQILQDGRLMFSIGYPSAEQPDRKLDQIYYSPIVFNRSNLGRWHHLAVTYDNCSGEAVQFVDGREVSRETSSLYQPGRKIVFGACELGNWGLPTRDREFAIRNLNGCLDEFIIHNAALTGAELRKMYEAGKVE